MEIKADHLFRFDLITKDTHTAAEVDAAALQSVIEDLGRSFPLYLAHILTYQENVLIKHISTKLGYDLSNLTDEQSRIINSTLREEVEGMMSHIQEYDKKVLELREIPNAS